MPNDVFVHAESDSIGGPARRISWGAIFAGVVVATVVQLLLSLLGIGIGMNVVDPQYEENPMSGLATGAAIWWVVSSLISLFLGGWAAGYLAGIPRRLSGALHGIVTWGLSTLLTIWLISTAIGAVVGGTMSLLSGGSGQETQAPQESGEPSQDWLSRIQAEAEQLLRDTGEPALQPEALEQEARQAGDVVREEATDILQNPGQAGQEIRQMFDRLQRQGEEAMSDVDREAAVNVLMRNSDMTRPEAQQAVANWEEQLRQARTQIPAKAREYSQKATDVTASAALWTFFGLLVGMLASMFGGMTGTPKHLIASDRS